MRGRTARLAATLGPGAWARWRARGGTAARRLGAAAWVGAVLLAASGLACSGPRSPDPDAGRSARYQAGTPDFDLEAVSSVERDSTGLDVSLSLPAASLIYRRDGSDYVGRVRWSVRVTSTADGAVSRAPVAWEETVRVPTLAATRTFAPIVRSRRFHLPPDVYRVDADVEDLSSTRTAERSVRVVVQSPEAMPALSALRLVAGPDSARRAVVATAVVQRPDSLRMRAQATAVPDGSVATARVLRLRVDSLVALEPAALSPMQGGLRARGVDAGRADTVFVDRQVLARPDVSIRIDAPVPRLGPGTYRLELSVRAPAGGAELGRSERTLVVRRRDFPALLRIGDLIDPLVYIASPREHAALAGASGAFAQRSAFDRFWGALIPDRRLAAATLRAYAERVEEANRLFSTTKEGWKTDRGMAYIVFGPPARVDAEIGGETWIYGSSGAVPALTFDRTASRALDGVPFDVLTLRRSPAYDRAWRTARRRWRSGLPT